MRTMRCIENHRALCLAALLGAGLLVDGCVDGAAGGAPPPAAPSDADAAGDPYGIASLDPPDTAAVLDYFQGLARGADQYRALCSRGYADRFARAYCAGPTPPNITSLADLLTLLGMRNGNGLTGNTFYALNSQNASVVSRDTSVLNPRAILFQTGAGFVSVGFARGSNLVEIAAQDTSTRDINFFLLHYQRACDATRSCTNADRFLPSNESGWQSVDVYSGHEDLKNTPRQCDTCHRPAGFDYTTNTGAAAILRMQQLVTPWTTWFRSDRGGAPLVATFCGAHTGEEYAGIPYKNICPNPQSGNGGPQQLQFLLIQPNNFQNDPHVVIYRGQTINNDNINYTGPPNAAYLALFAQVLAGKIIHIPYYKIDAFDDAKVSAAATAYTAVQAGTLPLSALPDVSATPLLAADAAPFVGHVGVNMNPVTGQPASATDVVNQMCATCHQGIFPGSGNRENFQVGAFPDQLSPLEKRRVANRICRPATSIYQMPPQVFGELSADNKALILTALGFGPGCPTK
jgi:hypothetical protein